MGLACFRVSAIILMVRFIEQREAKGTKNAFYDYCFLGALRFLLFKIMVRL
jgi:hypothetical protein